MKSRPVIAVDLESNGPDGPIIQIGAVVGDLASGLILEELSLYVNPNEQLRHSIKTLCSTITQELVDAAPPIEEQAAKLYALCTKYDVFTEAVVWGAGDTAKLAGELGHRNKMYFKQFIYIDARSVYKTWALKHGRKTQLGLLDSLGSCGLSFKGVEHDALDDARATFKIASFLTKEFKR